MLELRPAAETKDASGLTGEVGRKEGISRTLEITHTDREEVNQKDLLCEPQGPRSDPPLGTRTGGQISVPLTSLQGKEPGLLGEVAGSPGRAGGVWSIVSDKN